MATSRFDNADLITIDEAGTLPGLFRLRCERSPEGEAYRQFEGASEWVGRTWREMAALVARWQLALVRENLSPGDRVALCLRNSVEWICFDQAAQSLGLVVVPLYLADHAEGKTYVLADSGARLLLVGSHDQWLPIKPHQPRLPQLRRVLCLDTPTGLFPRTAPLVSLVSDWLPIAAPPQRNLAQDPLALATIIYTSGTTGRPKGVMLSHRNILSNASAVLQHQPGRTDDTYLSFLPLSHAFERTAGYYVPMMAGSRVVFARAVEHLAQDLLTIEPTILISVPRIYERVYAKLHQQRKKKISQLVIYLAITTVSKPHESHSRGAGGIEWLTRLFWPQLRHLIARRLLGAFGGKLRLAITGGAPMSAPLTHFFLGLGLPLMQGYGLTEASPVVTSNRLVDNNPESVGTPLPGVELRLGVDNELLVRGANVMMGYWNQPEATAAAIDAEGFLHTGDQARIEKGHVYIIGRLKEIIVMSTGEKVAPADLESALTQEPLIEQAMVVGEARAHLGALLVLNYRIWTDLARRWSLDPDKSDSLLDSRVGSRIQAHCRETLQGFPKHAQIRRCWWTLAPWTVDNGLMTPTAKLKRREIEQRYASQIQSLFKVQDAAKG